MASQTAAYWQAFFKTRGWDGLDEGVIIDLFDSMMASGAATTLASITGSAATLPVTGLAAAQGGSATLKGGASSTSGNAGGAAVVQGGLGGATGIGGAASLVGAIGGATSGKGGAANVTGGAGTAGNGDGGSVVVQPGAKHGTGLDGGVFLRGTSLFRKMAVPGAGADQAEVLTAAGMINTVFVHTITTGRTLTTPTGAAISAGCPTDLAAGDSFDFSVITVGTGADDIVTLTAGDGAVTFVGPVTVGPDAQATGLNGFGTWRFRLVSAGVWVGYRVG